MKVFIWQNIEQCTDSYHPEGGVVVFAETEQRAREIANKKSGCNIQPEEKPDEIRELTGGEEKVYIFPDAGCC